MNKVVVITGGAGDIAKAIANEIISVFNYDVLLPTRSELDVTNINTVNK